MRSAAQLCCSCKMRFSPSGIGRKTIPLTFPSLRLAKADGELRCKSLDFSQVVEPSPCLREGF